MSLERAATRQQLFTPGYILLLAATALFFCSMHAITPVLPLYGVAVGADTSTVGWLVGAFSVTALLARPYAGTLSERLGRKPLFVAGTVIFTLAPILYIFARSFPLLIAVRMVHGTGIALFIVGAYALVADMVPPSRRGEGMGYYSLTMLLGMAVAPPLAVPMLDVVGFEGIFIASALAGASSLILGLTVPEVARPVDYGPPPGFLAVARYRYVLVPSLALVGGTMSFGAIQSFLPLYTAERGAGNVGIFFSVYAISTLVSRVVVGRLSDAIGRMQVLIPAQVLLALTMLLLSRLSSAQDLIVVAVLYSVSFGSLLPVVTAVVVDEAPEEVRAAALNVSTASFDLGIGVGAVLLGMVGAWLGYPNMFLLTGLLSLCGAGILLWDRLARANRRMPAVRPARKGYERE